MSDWLLDRFTTWFCSGGGVWHTTIACLAVVVLELFDRSLDPHAFILMAVLTIYSAVTQPALAHSGAVQGERMEALERQNVALLSHLAQILDKQDEIHEAVKGAT